MNVNQGETSSCASFLQNNFSPFELGALEVQDNADFQLGDPEIVQNLTEMLLNDFFNRFDFDNQPPFHF